MVVIYLCQGLETRNVTEMPKWDFFFSSAEKKSMSHCFCLFCFQAPGKVVNLTVEALNYSAVNLIWFLPRQPNGKITSFKISVKHARSGIVVKDVLVKVEDLLSGRLPECNVSAAFSLKSSAQIFFDQCGHSVILVSSYFYIYYNSAFNMYALFCVTNFNII